MSGESQRLLFAVDQLAVDDDIKHAARAFDQLNVHAIGFFNCGRQTGGLWGVVSHSAKRDADVHRLSCEI